MNHFCYNSLFGFSEKELEKMENNHRTALFPALLTKKGEKHEKKERTQAPDRQGNRLRC